MHQPNDVAFATVHLATNLKLYYAKRGNREGAAIVFAHASGDSWFSYGRALPLLPREHHAFALDQRGHGGSDKPECCCTVDDFAADVDAFMDAVGIEEATLVGDSSDALLPREEQEWRAAAIPNATLRVYPETGHLVHWVWPEWVARHLEAFLREVRAT
jgi:pimeloyl-ACP methyl ester carboxylesterase